MGARPATASSRPRLDLFGTRGVEAVSLDEIAADVGVAKQTVLYWFPSQGRPRAGRARRTPRDELSRRRSRPRCGAAPDDPLERIEAVVSAVFRPAVRRPALLGLVREVSRLDPQQSELLPRPSCSPLVERRRRLPRAGDGRRPPAPADPRLVLSLCYATVTGIATEPEALRAVGWQPSVAGLRRLRTELLAFLRAALAPPGP